jgi:hypothetical protein
LYCRQKPLALQQKQAAETDRHELSPRKQMTFPRLALLLVDNFVNKEAETQDNLLAALFLRVRRPRGTSKNSFKIKQL